MFDLNGRYGNDAADILEAMRVAGRVLRFDSFAVAENGYRAILLADKIGCASFGTMFFLRPNRTGSAYRQINDRSEISPS